MTIDRLEAKKKVRATTNISLADRWKWRSKLIQNGMKSNAESRPSAGDPHCEQCIRRAAILSDAARTELLDVVDILQRATSILQRRTSENSAFSRIGFVLLTKECLLQCVCMATR